MITTIAFDLGNVILPFDVFRLAERLTKYTSFSSQEIIESLWNAYIANHFETGRMSPAEYFDHVTKKCQFEALSYEEFLPIFNDIFREDHLVTDAIKNLKSRYKLALISNTNPIHGDHVLEAYHFWPLFDHVLLSHEVGVRKPDPEIYRIFLKKFGIKGSEAVFVDDLDMNIRGAQALGIKTIHYKNFDSLKEGLANVGVTLPAEAAKPA